MKVGNLSHIVCRLSPSGLCT